MEIEKLAFVSLFLEPGGVTASDWHVEQGVREIIGEDGVEEVFVERHNRAVSVHVAFRNEPAADAALGKLGRSIMVEGKEVRVVNAERGPKNSPRGLGIVLDRLPRLLLRIPTSAVGNEWMRRSGKGLEGSVADALRAIGVKTEKVNAFAVLPSPATPPSQSTLLLRIMLDFETPSDADEALRELHGVLLRASPTSKRFRITVYPDHPHARYFSPSEVARREEAQRREDYHAKMKQAEEEKVKEHLQTAKEALRIAAAFSAAHETRQPMHRYAHPALHRFPFSLAKKLQHTLTSSLIPREQASAVLSEREKHQLQHEAGKMMEDATLLAHAIDTWWHFHMSFSARISAVVAVIAQEPIDLPPSRFEQGWLEDTREWITRYNTPREIKTELIRRAIKDMKRAARATFPSIHDVRYAVWARKLIASMKRIVDPASIRSTMSERLLQRDGEEEKDELEALMEGDLGGALPIPPDHELWPHETAWVGGILRQANQLLDRHHGEADASDASIVGDDTGIVADLQLAASECLFFATEFDERSKPKLTHDDDEVEEVCQVLRKHVERKTEEADEISRREVQKSAFLRSVAELVENHEEVKSVLARVLSALAIYIASREAEKSLERHVPADDTVVQMIFSHSAALDKVFSDLRQQDVVPACLVQATQDAASAVRDFVCKCFEDGSDVMALERTMLRRTISTLTETTSLFNRTMTSMAMRKGRARDNSDVTGVGSAFVAASWFAPESDSDAKDWDVALSNAIVRAWSAPVARIRIVVPPLFDAFKASSEWKSMLSYFDSAERSLSNCLDRDREKFKDKIEGLRQSHSALIPSGDGDSFPSVSSLREIASSAQELLEDVEASCHAAEMEASAAASQRRHVDHPYPTADSSSSSSGPLPPGSFPPPHHAPPPPPHHHHPYPPRGGGVLSSFVDPPPPRDAPPPVFPWRRLPFPEPIDPVPPVIPGCRHNAKERYFSSAGVDHGRRHFPWGVPDWARVKGRKGVGYVGATGSEVPPKERWSGRGEFHGDRLNWIPLGHDRDKLSYKYTSDGTRLPDGRPRSFLGTWVRQKRWPFSPIVRLSTSVEPPSPYTAPVSRQAKVKAPPLSVIKAPTPPSSSSSSSSLAITRPEELEEEVKMKLLLKRRKRRKVGEKRRREGEEGESGDGGGEGGEPGAKRTKTELENP